MAVAKGGLYVAPSYDTRSKTQLDSVVLESGLYQCSDSVTIDGITDTAWTVIAISNETQADIHCYSQIWISPSHPEKIFIRTSASGNTYSAYKTYLDSANVAQNKTSTPVEIYVQTTQPTVESGKTKIWINPSA